METGEKRLVQAVENRLNELRTNAYAVEKKAGLKSDAVRSILRGEKKSGTTLNNAQQVCDALDLELYIGPRREQCEAPAVNLDDTSFSMVNRYEGRVAAGNGQINYDAPPIDRLAFSNDWLRRQNISAGDSFLISVTGDSMTPRIFDGDLVMIDTRRKQVRNGRVYALNDGDHGTRIKRVEIIPDVGLVLRSDNPDYEPEYRTGPAADEVEIIGQVVWSGHRWD